MAKKKGSTGNLVSGEKDSPVIEEPTEELEVFDGADADVSVPDGEGVKLPPKNVGVEDAEIIEKDEGPEVEETVAEEPVSGEEVAEKAKTMTREELVAAGILPKETKHPNSKALADAVHEQITGEAPVEAVPQAKQIDEDYQQQLHQHHSQQGSIALEIIKAMVSNDTVSMKTNPKKLVERAYEITDELQAVLDQRHKDALMEAFTQLNS